MLTSIAQAITDEGGLSANYTLSIVVGACGFLIVALLTFVYNNLNNNIKQLSDNFALFQKDFHEFVEIQSGLNSRFEERTKKIK